MNRKNGIHSLATGLGVALFVALALWLVRSEGRRHRDWLRETRREAAAVQRDVSGNPEANSTAADKIQPSRNHISTARPTDAASGAPQPRVTGRATARSAAGDRAAIPTHAGGSEQEPAAVEDFDMDDHIVFPEPVGDATDR
jgi:hypothetical protein